MIRSTQGRKQATENQFLLFSKLRWVVCVCVWGLGVSQTSKGFNFQFKKEKKKEISSSCVFSRNFFLKSFLLGRGEMSRMEFDGVEKTNLWTLKKKSRNRKKGKGVFVLRGGGEQGNFGRKITWRERSSIEKEKITTNKEKLDFSI